MIKFKGVIFDLDETLINSSSLKSYRDRREWRYCYENAGICNVYDSLEEFLNSLHKNSIPVGIVTNSPRKYAETLLKTHNIKFDILIAYHDCEPRKPHPAPMLKCAELLQVSPEQILSIGDDPKDIQSSNRAGMTSVAVTWGITQRSNFISAQPDYIVDSASELFKIINE